MVSVKTTTNQASVAAGELVALAPTFTSANGINYTVTRSDRAIFFETTGAETRDGTFIPTSNFVINYVGGSIIDRA